MVADAIVPRITEEAFRMQALERLISILEAVSVNGEPSRPSEIAQTLDLPLPTVARLMHQLADENLLHRSTRDGAYTLGPRFLALARVAASRLDLTELSRPALEELRDITGETASLHVLRGVQRVCICEVQSRHPVRRVVPVGLAQPLHGNATGEVLLAGAPEPERRAAIRAARLSAKERRALEGRLEQAREQGYLLVVDTWVKGLAGLSVPVEDGNTTLAAVSVSGPSDRLTEEIALSHVTTVINVARRLSHQLGGEESEAPDALPAPDRGRPPRTPA